MSVIEFLNTHQGFFLVLFTAAVCVAAWRQAQASVKYSRLTEQLVAETLLMRKAQTDPQLSVSLLPHDFAFGFLDLRIRNEGGGAARNIQFTVAPDADADPEVTKTLQGFGFVQGGIGYLGPRQEIRTYFANCNMGGEQRMRTKIGVTATFNTPRGEAYEEHYVLDFLAYRNYFSLGTPPLVALKDAIEKLGANLAQIANVVSRPRV